MCERLDLISRVPQLLAGFGIQCVNHRVRRILDPDAALIGAEPELRRGLHAGFAVAVRIHHSVGDDRRLRLIHIARDPRRRHHNLPVQLFHLPCHDRAVSHRTVRDRHFEIRMRRTPDRTEQPARTLGILPRGQAAPHTGGGEVHFFIAHPRGANQWRAMIGAAQIVTVQQKDAALFAGGSEEPVTLVVEERGRDLHVQIHLPQPQRVRRREIILERSVFTYRDNRLCPHVLGRVEVAIAGGRVGNAFLIHRRAATSPASTTGGE